MIERDLGDRIAELFADFDPDAAAAASIGQVYRARLHDGRAVAVKVQYPGIASAVRADLQNLRLLIRAARRFAPGLDPDSTALEVRERISRGARLRARGSGSARVRKALAWPPVHRHPRRDHRLVPRARARHRMGGRHRVRAAQEATRRRHVTASARSSFASTSVRSTASDSSRAIRTRATSCSSPTAAWRFLTSA